MKLGIYFISVNLVSTEAKGNIFVSGFEEITQTFQKQQNSADVHDAKRSSVSRVTGKLVAACWLNSLSINS